MSDHKPPVFWICLVFSLAFLGFAWTAFLHAQSLHSISPRSNLSQSKKPRFGTPQATHSWVYPDATGRQKPRGQPGRSVTWSGFSLTPRPGVRPTPTKGPEVKAPGLKNKKTPYLELKGKWFSLANTPTPLPFSSKIKPLQPSKDSPAQKGYPVKVPTFSAWNMKFMKNQGSIYQGKDGKAASILLRFTPVTTPNQSQ